MARSRSFSAFLIAALGAVVLTTVSPVAPRAQTAPGPYTVLDLGTLGGLSTQPSDINNESQIVGYSTTGGSSARGFLWEDGSMTALPPLSGGFASFADAVNGLGHVVGYSTFQTGIARAVLCRDGGVVNLTPDLPVSVGSTATGINDLDQVVGLINNTQGFLWDNGSRVMLGTLGGPGGSFASDINNAGQVVGSSSTTNVTALGPMPHAFLWQNGVMTDLGLLPGDEDSGASAINSHGVIVGSSGRTDPETYETTYKPFIYANGVMTAIAAPSVDAYAGDINDDGVVVGTMQAAGGFSRWHAWIAVNGVVTNLNSRITPCSGLHLAFAKAINNDGQIVGVAYDAQGRYHGFLLTPGGSLPPVVPSISINDVIRDEGKSGTTAFTFTVQLSVAATSTVRVNFATANVSAIAGQDYAGAAGTLVFNPGELTKTVTVAVNGDRTREQDETFRVNLAAPDGATIFDAQGVGTIRNDDR
jgi:probable HAF family extracellular repeat protein